MPSEEELLLYLAVILLISLWHPREQSSIVRRPPRGPQLLVEWRESPRLMRDALGCLPQTFDKLLEWICAHSSLKDNRYMDLEEKVAVFLWILRSGNSFAECGVLFKRGRGTISR